MLLNLWYGHDVAEGEEMGSPDGIQEGLGWRFDGGRKDHDYSSGRVPLWQYP